MSARRSALALGALLLLPLAPAAVRAQGGAAPAPKEPPLRIAASSFATVEVHLNSRRIGSSWYEEDASLTGPSRIAISYGQPHARGRRIVGGLVPTDTVWRFGANAVTTLHTDVDIAIDSLRVPRGDYSLYMIHLSSGAWQLIVNRRTGLWGTERDPGADMGRVTLAARTRAEPEETLSIYLTPESARPTSGYADLRGTLRVVWGTTELSTGWRVLP